MVDTRCVPILIPVLETAPTWPKMLASVSATTEVQGFRGLSEHLEPRFCLPGHKYISKTAWPKLHKAVKEHVLCMLKDVHALGSTTDIWSSDMCPTSLLSLTAHWVDRESTLTPRSAALHASEFPGSHTGEWQEDCCTFQTLATGCYTPRGSSKRSENAHQTSAPRRSNEVEQYLLNGGEFTGAEGVNFSIWSWPQSASYPHS